MLSISHILVTMLTNGHSWGMDARGCCCYHKRSMTIAWGDNQELLNLMKCLANFPSVSISQWCSLHHLRFCLTIFRKQNQTTRTKPRNLDTGVVLLCGDVHSCFNRTFTYTSLGLLNYFSLKVDGETFGCYLNNFCTFSSNLAQNFGKPSCNL